MTSKKSRQAKAVIEHQEFLSKIEESTVHLLSGSVYNRKVIKRTVKQLIEIAKERFDTGEILTWLEQQRVMEAVAARLNG